MNVALFKVIPYEETKKSQTHAGKLVRVNLDGEQVKFSFLLGTSLCPLKKIQNIKSIQYLGEFWFWYSKSVLSLPYQYLGEFWFWYSKSVLSLPVRERDGERGA
jgi:hypothetical protein